MTYSYPSARGWGSGWPYCSTSKWTPVGSIEGTNATFGNVREEIAPLARLLIRESVMRGYVFKAGQCWGAVCRPVRGSTTTPSFHSWGLALDFNSATNWLGRTDGGDIPGWMVSLWGAYGFFWGGNYASRKDPMHFEYAGTPSQAQTDLERARRDGIGEDRMTDAEKAAFQALQARVADLEHLNDGMTARIQGKGEPDEAGPKRNGWRKADQFLNEPAP